MPEANQKTAFFLFIIRFLKLVISVATLSIAAKYFGISTQRESWLLTLNFIIVINLAIWGPLNEIFRAKFIFIKANEGETAALRRTSNLFVFSLVVMLLIAILVHFFAHPISKLIAPAYDSEKLSIVVSIVRFMIWSTILTQATQLLSSILNTYDSFYIPEFSGFFSALLNFFIIIILSKHIGIYSFVVANYVSALVLLLALIYQTSKLNIALFQSKIDLSWKEISPFILFSLPFFMPYIVGQCNGLIEKSIGNMMGNGTVSIIDYAKKIAEIIQTVLSSVLVTIMVPSISVQFANGLLEKVKEESLKYLQLVLLILSILIPLLLVSADPITHILFDKGSISKIDLATISFLMRIYSIGLLAVFIYLVFGLTLLSTNKNKDYAMYGMFAQLMMMAINVLAYRYWGIYTFTISLTASHLLVGIIMFLKLPVSGKIAYVKTILQYASFGILLALIIIAVNYFLFCPVNAYINVLYNLILLLVLAIFLGKPFRIEALQNIKALKKIRK